MTKPRRTHLWKLVQRNEPAAAGRRTGLRLRFDREVHPEVRAACLRFARWLRKEYAFPVRVPVYIKSAARIRTMDGDSVVGSFFEPDNFAQEPYIRISTGDYAELADRHGRDNALAAILSSFAHELTHYYQWINVLSLTDRGRERQASLYARHILDEYAETCEHP